MRKYQIVKHTLANGEFKFEIQYFTVNGTWLKISERADIESARITVEQMKGNEIVSSEVVE